MRLTAILPVTAMLAACVTLRSPQLRAGADASNLARQSGVFVTSADFASGLLTDAMECTSDSRPVDRAAFSETAVVSMPADGSRQFAKATIFGFRACDGTDVRFVNGESYHVVRAPPLYLYEHEYRASRGKGGSQSLTHYLFSTTAGDSVRPLTLDALKRAYPENHLFHDQLDLAFRSNEELMRYDDYHHEYRVARLLRQSLRQGIE